MRIFLTIISLCLTGIYSHAHPSWGIAVRANGDIYFTDILHENGTLWKVNENGGLIKLLTNFHAHDLYLDDEASLWLAENQSIEGNIEAKSKYTLLRLNENESIDTLIITYDPKLFNGIHLAIDKEESIFFENDNRIYRYNPKKAEQFINYQFGLVTNLWADNEGNLWIADSKTDNGTLFRYSKKGQLKKIASNLMPEDPSYPLFKEKHLQFITGIAKDKNGNLYISENAGCRIVKVSPKGEKSVFYQSLTLWAPMNVTFHNGNAYILEVGFNKKSHKGPRVLKRDASGIHRIVNIDNVPKETISDARQEKSFSIPNWVYFAIGMLIFSLVIILSVKKQYNNT